MARDAFKIVNPGAAVVIYNYRDRLGTTNTGQIDAQETDQIILGTTSLLSVTTSKSKSQAQGTFEFALAPWKNWTTAITPGSWCVILMGQTPIKPSEAKYANTKVDKRHFKMIGRIESVRASTTVDQVSGALNTSYIVTGTDWAGMFNSFLYVDPASRSLEESAVGSANRMFYQDLVTVDGKTGKQVNLFDSMAAVRAIMSFWGTSDPRTDALMDISNNKVLSKAVNKFGMPIELVEYMGFQDASGKANQFVTALLKTRGNVLLDYDTYSSIDNVADEAHADGVGYIDPACIFGMNSLWQIMMDNCNRPLNELIADVRWEGDVPQLCVYKRVKPFKIRSFDEVRMNTNNTDDNQAKDPNAASDIATDFLRSQESDFKNVRRHEIAGEDIIAVNAGTNWRDRFNFVEVHVAKQIIPAFQGKDQVSIANKISAQFFDHKSIQRDGLIPMRMDVNYLPRGISEEKIFDIDKVYAYKYLGKEWFFDTHKMLNGVVTLIGQDNYIQVGDNIIFRADVLSSNFNTNEASLNNSEDAYITCHVETISHRSSVSADGSRTFTTEIQFVRGIVTNFNGDRLSATSEMTLDQDVEKINEFQERNSDRVLGTSSGYKGKQDPDQQRLGQGER